MRRARVRRPSASATAAMVVLLPVAGLVLLSFAGGVSSSGGGSSDLVLTARQIQAQSLGTSRNEIEHRFGKGFDALGFNDTGVAVEPMDATCTYYRAAQDNFYDVAQFCFRDDKLVSRRAFIVPRV